MTSENLGVLHFKQWKALVENQKGRKIKKLRTDNGLEFNKEEFNQFCADEGIGRHHTVRMTPQQNSVAQQVNQTLLKRVRCMLSNVGLGRRYQSLLIQGRKGRTCYRQMGCLRYTSHPLLIYLKCNLLMMMLRFQCQVLLKLRLFLLLLTLGEEVEQSKQGLSSQSDTILKRPR